MVIAARREDKLQEVADEIKSAGGEAAIVVGDISKVESWLVWQATCIISSGRVNFLFMDASLCACLVCLLCSVTGRRMFAIRRFVQTVVCEDGVCLQELRGGRAQQQKMDPPPQINSSHTGRQTT